MKSRFSALLGLGIAAALTVTGVANASAAEGVPCTITGTSPQVMVLGPTAQPVQFGVQTECDGVRPVSWSLSSDIYPGSSGASWLLLRNYDYPYGEKFTYVEDPQGFFPVNVIGNGPFQGNAMAGPHPLNATAFHDADGDGVVDGDEPVTTFSGSVVAKRASTFGDSFSVTAGSFSAALSGRRGPQRITVTGSLQRANWDSGQYDHLAAWVDLQFRPAGSSQYRTVKTVWDNGISATTTVKATKTGSWRYHYAGDEISGAARSNAVTVVVHRR
jgi:hypothetical protein